MTTRKLLSTSLLLLLFSLTACNGQEKATRERRLPIEKTASPTDFDPYFVPAATTYSKQGPSSITRNIVQDRSGNIWLATWEGIIRYDGTSFTNFTRQNYLRKFHVFSALQDRDGKLWFGTIGAGIYRYDGKNFTNITQKDGLAHDKQGCFYQDRSGKIWIGTMGGISIYDGTSYRNLTTEDGLPDNDINSIIEDRAGKIWIASRGALCTYDGETFTRVRKDKNQLIPTLSGNDAASFFNVRSIIEDQKGNIWFGGKDGFWRYGTNGRLTQFSNKFTGCVFEDHHGNIWTNSEGSVNQEWWVSRYAAGDLEGDKMEPSVLLKERNMFFGITEDSDGGIWIGSLRGVGRYDGTAFDWFREE